MASKEMLHRLVEELPPQEWPTAERMLQYLRNVGSDPVVRAFMAAPLDDEPLTKEEEAAINEAEEEIASGQGLAWEEVRERLGRTRTGSA